MTRDKAISYLSHRRKFLIARIEDRISQGLNVSFDEQERDALESAIDAMVQQKGENGTVQSPDIRKRPVEKVFRGITRVELRY